MAKEKEALTPESPARVYVTCEIGFLVVSYSLLNSHVEGLNLKMSP